MSADSPAATGDDAQLFGELAAVINSITGNETAPARTARLEADLRLDSIELAALAQRVTERFGVDLADQWTELSFDELVDYSVADLLALVSDRGTAR
jgi:acyl carrier protein